MRSSWLLVVALAVVGCAPLTFSSDEGIDFSRYQSVRVTVDIDGDEADPTYTSYFVGELESVSGFGLVTTSPDASVDLIIVVRVETDTQIDYSSDDPVVEHLAYAGWTASTPSGRSVARGNETDTSGTYEEAIEDVLDEVAFRFILPYRF